MQRVHQIVFVVSLLWLSWLGMMAVHEAGHVVGAVFTGGEVERVVLHPLAISRTDVLPNPHPAAVVWMGPIIGCLLPCAMWPLVPRRALTMRRCGQFFVGFCFVANGAYIGGGSFAAIGDCGEMLRTGTPIWLMIAFGAAAVALGFYLWHSLGSLTEFLANPSRVAPGTAYASFAMLLAVVAVELALSTW